MVSDDDFLFLIGKGLLAFCAEEKIASFKLILNLSRIARSVGAI